MINANGPQRLMKISMLPPDEFEKLAKEIELQEHLPQESNEVENDFEDHSLLQHDPLTFLLVVETVCYIVAALL